MFPFLTNNTQETNANIEAEIGGLSLLYNTARI